MLISCALSPAETHKVWIPPGTWWPWQQNSTTALAGPRLLSSVTFSLLETPVYVDASSFKNISSSLIFRSFCSQTRYQSRAGCIPSNIQWQKFIWLDLHILVLASYSMLIVSLMANQSLSPIIIATHATR